MARLAAFAIGLATFAAGCGGHHAGRAWATTPQQALHNVRSARHEWLGEVRTNARKDPTRRFPAPPPQVLRRRLAAAAAQHGLRIASVTWRRGIQRIPDVVLESNDYTQAAHALPHILDAIDPPPRSNDRVYEAIFIEVVDAEHVPYVAIFDALRDHVLGGQWARAEDLYPYAHF